jgi:hypothetical protein
VVDVSGWKLFLGKQWAAWRDFPATRQRLASADAGPPILVTGAHRSGTTWVGRMLAASGAWPIHEPTAPYQGLWPQWYTYAPASRPNEALNRVFEELLRGRHRRAVNLEWSEHALMPVRWLPIPIRRVLVKDPIASLASESLVRHFGMQGLALFRHPGAFVESVTRLGWPCAPLVRQFLTDDSLMAEWLEPHRGRMRQVKGADPVYDAAVLHGCICTVLWGYTGRTPALRAVRFEDLASAPMESFERWFAELRLRYDDDVRREHAEICFGAADSPYRPHEVRRHSSEMAWAWRDRLGDADRARILDVWRGFEVPLYADAGDW